MRRLAAVADGSHGPHGAGGSSFDKLYVVRMHSYCALAPTEPLFTFEHPNPSLPHPNPSLPHSGGAAPGAGGAAPGAGCAARGAGGGDSASAADEAQEGAPGPWPDNARHHVLRFSCELGGTLHGFGGYFECELYRRSTGGAGGGAAAAADAISFSTNPPTASAGMFSWFPAFLPLRTPIDVSPGETVELHVWRCVDEARARVWYEWALTQPAVSPVHNPNGSSYWIGL